MTALKNLDAEISAVDPNRINLSRGIRDEFVYRYDRGYAELSDVSKMPTQVFEPLLQRADTLGIEVRLCNPSMHFEGPGGSH